MIPGITALFPFADVGPIDEAIPIELVYAHTPGGTNHSFTFDPGPAFPERFVLCFFTIARGVVTGNPSEINLTVDGTSVALNSVSNGQSWLYFGGAWIPNGTEPIACNLSQVNGDNRAINIWLVGKPGDQGKVIQASAGSATTTNPVSALLRNDFYVPRSKVVVNSLRRNTSDAEVLLFADEWLEMVFNTTGNFGGSTGRVQAAHGIMPPWATEVTNPASEASLGKSIAEFQAAPREPNDLIWLTAQGNVAYHFSADFGCFSDLDGLIPCTDGDPVALWKNKGVYAQDAIQTTPARRPIWRASGANGKPYIEFDAAEQHWFEDLTGIPQPSSISGINGHNKFAIVDIADLDAIRPIIGGSVSNTKQGLWVTTSGQIRIYKNQMVRGTVPTNELVVIRGQATSGSNFNTNINDSYSSSSAGTNSSSTAQPNAQFFRSSGNGYFFSGKAYEVVLYDTGAGRSHGDMLCRALMAKYGIPKT